MVLLDRFTCRLQASSAVASATIPWPAISQVPGLPVTICGTCILAGCSKNCVGTPSPVLLLPGQDEKIRNSRARW